MTNRFFASLAALAAVIAVVALARVSLTGRQPPTPAANAAKTPASPANWTPLRTTWGHPDLQGVWDSTTGTPLERPADLAGKEFLSDAEAIERERKRFQEFDSPNRGAQNPTGDYGSVWREGSKNALNRTSLIVDPKDGKIPPLTPEGKKAAEGRAQARRARGPADSWEDLGLWTRCITRGTPRIPNNYNSNWHILQTPTYVTIHQEMIHENRIVYLDGRPHVGQNIRLWKGDSRGRWEGNTLVVETTNFNDNQEFRGFPMNNARLVERFTRIAPDKMDYQFTIDDPTTFTRPWTVSLPMTKNLEPYFEYACHEGNHGLVGILAGHRAEEKAGKKPAGRYGDEGGRGR